MPKQKKTDEKDIQNAELTADLQRLRADFENYRKQVENEKAEARRSGSEKTTKDILPVIDNIERAVSHTPKEIAENQWVQGISGLAKQLDKTLAGLGLNRISAAPGTQFDPEYHQAVQFNEDAEGDTEVVAEELQAGYTLNGRLVRPAMVAVTRK